MTKFVNQEYLKVIKYYWNLSWILLPYNPGSNNIIMEVILLFKDVKSNRVREMYKLLITPSDFTEPIYLDG